MGETSKRNVNNLSATESLFVAKHKSQHGKGKKFVYLSSVYGLPTASILSSVKSKIPNSVSQTKSLSLCFVS